MAEAYALPTKGASLLLSFRLASQTVLIVGSNSLAATRAFAALEADSDVIILTNGGLLAACNELQWRAQNNQLRILDLDALPCSSQAAIDRDAEALGELLSSSDGIRLVCITDTMAGTASRRSRSSAQLISQACRFRNIPVNVTDMPDLCDFTFMSSHRFRDPETDAASPLQIGITANGHGCRLASRLRRDIVSKLPRDAGSAAVNIRKLKDLARSSDGAIVEDVEGELNEEAGPSTPNRPVSQRNVDESVHEHAKRRMKWVAQVSEYWPIQQLAKMSDGDMISVLDGRIGLPGSLSTEADRTTLRSPQSHGDTYSLHSLSIQPSQRHGKIYLVGSGPGHPSLLTLATHTALTKHADLVLSDKLVPAAVLALIPPGIEIRIARKFPGNADGAQFELMEAAIEAAKCGKTVVRGDPSVYGRAGEEILYFRGHGFEPIVVPGVSSVLAGPTFAGIPVTQRGAAESFVVCTGVGRQGKEVRLPGYERSRTLVILMGVARLPQILETLNAQGEQTSRRNGPAYPAHTPIAIIERASMPDQRVIFSTLQHILCALENSGEQRPPGMMVVGWSVLSLWDKGDVSVLDDAAEAQDEERLRSWLGDHRWRILDGLDSGWEEWQ
ncbi:uncharacterized protein FIBRA_00913 [Fibroporia radiculosa]|uniref:precorrin-2 dehydrogenase n=1 Tax=Fibroporia radiculosa TaxID=599839 RepID=J4I872_9APHY|nr:uncharacterized protein FIBRA_00913 [Fibroporia radiculosa]CCL98906.1 predicted protein [Fibroporia radiculosa]